MNRKDRRLLSRHDIGQQALHDAFKEQWQKCQRDAYNNAFAAMLLVLDKVIVHTTFDLGKNVKA